MIAPSVDGVTNLDLKLCPLFGYTNPLSKGCYHAEVTPSFRPRYSFTRGKRVLVTRRARL
jgi:hypothetical protein